MSVETNEWADAEHAQGFLDRRAGLPRMEVGYAELLEILPANPKRVLDLGCGDGKAMAMIGGSGVALDFSAHMLELARARFHADDVEVVEHNLNAPLPDVGTFDVVVSAFAIHHCSHERKRELYAEVFAILEPDGVSDDKGRVDLAFLDAAQQVVGPAVHVRLAGAHGEGLVHERAERDLVDQAAVDAGNR